MLNHADNASHHASSVAAAISHSPMLKGTGLAVGGGVTVSSLSDVNVSAANEAGYWFTHAEIWIFTPQQVCTIIGTIWVVMCATNMMIQVIKSIKSKPRKPRKTPDDIQKPPVIQGGSGSGKPPIKPQ